MPESISSTSETGASTYNTGNTWEAAKAGVTDTVCGGEALLRSNPVGAVLGALAIGVAIGYLVSQREPTKRERYLEQPLEDLQSLVRTLADRATKQAGRGSDAAAGAVESLLARIKKNLNF